MSIVTMSLGLLLAAFQTPGGSPPEPAEAQDLILAIDVSLSMTADEESLKGPNDPFGFRWDGAQFAVDMARPNDQIALIIFRANAAVVTREIDPSGYVTIGANYRGKTGRESLKALIEGLRQLEATVAAEMPEARRREIASGVINRPDALSTSLKARKILDPGHDALWHGTSSVEALRTILGSLPPGPKAAARAAGRKTRVLLFTDGEEHPPARNEVNLDEPSYRKKYAYAAEMTAGGILGTLPGEVDRLIEEYRGKDIPVYTFGLGESIDRDFLRAISEKSRPPELVDDRMVAATYTPKDGEELFRVMREVIWEFRRYWFWTQSLSGEAGSPTVLSTPNLGFGHELGLTAYIKKVETMDVGLFRKPGKEGSLATAERRPPATARVMRHPEALPRMTMSARRQNDVPPFPLDILPFQSRSHLHYDLSTPSDGGAARMGGVVNVERPRPLKPGETWECVAAARTNFELFDYESPRQGSRYTPKDAIPIRVRFRVPLNADFGLRFAASDFEVKARFLANGKADRIVPVELEPAEVPGDPATSFVGWLQLDSDPESKENPNLKGPYSVDVTITAKGGPLQGASRRLIRRSITVDDYPTPAIRGGRVVLSNEPEATIAPEVKVEFDGMSTRPDRDIAALRAEVIPPVGSAGRAPIASGQIRTTILPGSATSPPRVQVEIDDEAWTKLPPGVYPAGTLRVQTPWGKSVDAPVEVHRVASAVTTTPTRLALAFASVPGGREARREVRMNASLAAGSPIIEEAILIDPAAKSSTGGRVTFARDGGGPPIQLRVKGLGQPARLRAAGGPGPNGGWSIEVEPEGSLSSGSYRHELKIRGGSITELTVPVEVQVDSPRAYLVGKTGGPVPIDELDLPGLAGTHVRRTLQIGSDPHSKRPIRDLQVKSVRLAFGPEGEAEGLVLTPKLSKGSGDLWNLALDASIPTCVRPGRYVGKMLLSGTFQADQTFLLSMPLHLNVAHRGVRIEVEGQPIEGPFRVAAGDKSPLASKAFTLTASPEVGEGPIRWEARRHPSPTPPPGTLAVKPRGRLDIVFDGNNSILTDRSPKDTVTKTRPSPLTLKFDASGLAPGLYSETIQFVAADDEANPEVVDWGSATDLPVVVLVPGRVIRSFDQAPAGREVVTGNSLPLRLVVDAYGCPVALGTLQPVRAPGIISGKGIDLVPAPSAVDELFPKDLTHHVFLAQVTPIHSGPNRYEVRWPRLDPSGPDPEIRQALSIDARGRIEITPSADQSRTDKFQTSSQSPIIYENEEVIIKVAVDRDAALKMGPVKLRHNTPGATEPLVLSYDGEAFTTRTTAFNRLGEWRVESVDPNGALRLAPATVEVGFRLVSPEPLLGSITHGGGAFLGWKQNHEKLTILEFLKIENHRVSNCTIAAEVGYAKTTGAGGAAPVGADPAANRLLSANLQGEGHLPSPRVEATLAQGDSRNYGLELGLTDQAKRFIYNVTGSEPQGLGEPQELQAGLSIRWGDDRARTFVFPTVVNSTSDKFVAVFFHAALVLIVVGPLGYLAYRYRHLWKRSSATTTTEETDSSDLMGPFDSEPAGTSTGAEPAKGRSGPGWWGKRSRPASDDGDDEAPERSSRRDADDLPGFFRDDD